MPEYKVQCRNCGKKATRFFKHPKDYDHEFCPDCGTQSFVKLGEVPPVRQKEGWPKGEK
jgi:rRNA maturation endonuclease Nob1